MLNGTDRLLALLHDCGAFKNITLNDLASYLNISTGNAAPTIVYLGANTPIDLTQLNTLQYNGAGFTYFVDKNGNGAVVKTPPTYRTVLNVDALVAGTTDISFSSLLGKVVPDKIKIIVRAKTGAGVGPQISLGTNNPDYDNVLENYQVLGSAVDDVETVEITDTTALGPGSTLKLNVDVAATGYTAYKFDVIFYFNPL